EIAEESQHGYDAVVVGRRGKSKLKDLILGGTAGKLIDRLAHVPVWVVGGSPKPGKVLLAVDGSENAMKAVDYVGRMFEGSTPEVTILHVVRVLGLFQGTYPEAFHTEINQKWLADVQERMMPVLEKAKDTLTRAGLDPGRMTISLETGKGSRAGDIVEQAYLGSYGTIVVGRRGISKIEQFLMGRVSSKVMQLAKDMAVWVVN
ncbi:MAG: universal stress protein, partial [Deltaproteobacteria bacterium]|nr:universal stress protein [Deltaproteobacteria bacterium]